MKAKAASPEEKVSDSSSEEGFGITILTKVQSVGPSSPE